MTIVRAGMPPLPTLSGRHKGAHPMSRSVVSKCIPLLFLALVQVGCGKDESPTSPYTQPRFLTAWGSRGTAAGQFDLPSGIAVDTSGRVYVADRNNHRIQMFDASGNWLRMWGSMGAATGAFRYPSSVAV